MRKKTMFSVIVILFLFSILILLKNSDVTSLNMLHTVSSPIPVVSYTTNPIPNETDMVQQSIEPNRSSLEPALTPPVATTTPHEKLPAFSTINKEDLDVSKMEHYFCKMNISDEIFKRINNKSYKADCPIPLEDLCYLRVLHYGFDQETHIGELIVNTAIADKVLSIFKELYDGNYPIEKMVLIDNYDADDEASMEDNNSSCFNYRVIDGTDKLSKHSLGIAIDINPLYNPYVRKGKGERSVLPINGAIYADRTLACPYYIDTNDLCYKTFIKYGFTWGGSWTHSKDYQHFQISLD